MSVSDSNTKCCGRCRTIKPTTDFYRSKARGDGLSGICKDCQKDASQRYLAKKLVDNPDYYKELYQQNLEGNRAKDARYRRNNPEKVKEKTRRRYHENKEYHRKKSREWFSNNKEYAAAQARKAYKQSAGRVLAKNRKRKALRRNAVGEHTAEDIQQMYEDQGGLCAYCEIPLLGSYEVDHMVPLSRNGTNGVENLALACMPCNRSKGAQTVEEFLVQ